MDADLILNFPKNIKIQLLRDALKQGNIGIFFGLSKILLDAPITKGGIESEIIEQIHQEYLNSLPDES